MKKTSRSMWLTSGCYMWLQFCYLRLKIPVWSASALPSPVSTFVWKLKSFSFKRSKEVWRRQRTKWCKHIWGTGIEIRNCRLPLHLSSSWFSQLGNTYIFIFFTVFWNCRTFECCWNVGITFYQLFSFSWNVDKKSFKNLSDELTPGATRVVHHQDQAESTDGSSETQT